MAIVSKTTQEMMTHVSDLSEQYERELLSILESLKPEVEEPMVEGKLEAQKRKDKISRRKTGTRPLSRKEQDKLKKMADMVESNKPNDNIPSWAKSLYRSFMKTYHPDKVKDSSILEIVGAINNMYQNEEYENMLCKCAEFDIFTDKLSFEKQKSMIQAITVRHTNALSKMQESVAWKWGTVISESEEATLSLLAILCQKNGFPPPKREKMISVLKTFDIF